MVPAWYRNKFAFESNKNKKYEYLELKHLFNK